MSDHVQYPKEVGQKEEVKPEVKNLEETRFPIDITPGNDKSEINIKPEFQVHVAVNENENININIKPDIKNHVESIQEQQRPLQKQECLETEENHQQVEVKTEYEFIN